MTTNKYKYNFNLVGLLFAVVLLCAIICTTTLTYASEEIVPYSSGTLGGEPLLILGKNRSDDPLTVKKITDFSNIHFIPNANYFLINPKHCKNRCFPPQTVPSIFAQSKPTTDLSTW